MTRSKDIENIRKGLITRSTFNFSDREKIMAKRTRNAIIKNVVNYTLRGVAGSPTGMILQNTLIPEKIGDGTFGTAEQKKTFFEKYDQERRDEKADEFAESVRQGQEQADKEFEASVNLNNINPDYGELSIPSDRLSTRQQRRDSIREPMERQRVSRQRTRDFEKMERLSRTA